MPKLVLVFLCAVVGQFVCTQAQALSTSTNNDDLVYTQPTQKWEMPSGGRVQSEVRIAPDGKRVISLTDACALTAFATENGTEEWSVSPPNPNSVTAGLLFGTTPSGVDYVAVPVAAEDDNGYSK